jgi:hypothetical protein
MKSAVRLRYFSTIQQLADEVYVERSGVFEAKIVTIISEINFEFMLKYFKDIKGIISDECFSTELSHNKADVSLNATSGVDNFYRRCPRIKEMAFLKTSSELVIRNLYDYELMATI